MASAESSHGERRSPIWDIAGIALAIGALAIGADTLGHVIHRSLH